MTDAIKRLKELIDGSNNIVALTGAGCSTESGIPDFRSTKGIYEKEGTNAPISTETVPLVPICS